MISGKNTNSFKKDSRESKRKTWWCIIVPPKKIETSGGCRKLYVSWKSWATLNSFWRKLEKFIIWCVTCTERDLLLWRKVFKIAQWKEKKITVWAINKKFKNWENWKGILEKKIQKEDKKQDQQELQEVAKNAVELFQNCC